ncbi:MAG: hypothetical protein Q9202_007450 [Teloschistes flavicans]
MDTPAANATAEKKRPLQTETEVLSEAERDEQALARLGKKPILKKFVSYIMGWLVICGWQAILAGSAYLGGNMILALATLNHADYAPELWQGTLVYWAVMAVSIGINTAFSRILPKIESFILGIHLGGFLAILVPLVYLAPEKASTRDVFAVFENGGGWPTTTLSVFVGLLGSVFATYGTDCAVHMAEEIHGANVVIPWCMLSTTLLNGILGFAMLVAILFVTVDIDSVLKSPTGALGFPFMQVLYDATGSRGGATAMICLIIIMMICASIAFLATSSRIVFAFGRDRGLPFSRTMATLKVQSSTAIPLHAIFVMAFVSCLIGLINIGSATAFNAVISLGVSSLYASYVLTEALLLYHRIRGTIRSPSQMSNSTWHANELVWGPFHVPGIWGILLNTFAVGYGIIVIIFSVFPQVVNPTPAQMNYSCLVTGAILLFAVLYYFTYARKVYTGPVVEIAPHQIA